MTVAELIAALENMNPDAPVRIVINQFMPMVEEVGRVADAWQEVEEEELEDGGTLMHPVADGFVALITGRQVGYLPEGQRRDLRLERY